jgi:hypothetical protein
VARGARTVIGETGIVGGVRGKVAIGALSTGARSAPTGERPLGDGKAKAGSALDQAGGS